MFEPHIHKEIMGELITQTIGEYNLCLEQTGKLKCKMTGKGIGGIQR